MQDWSLETHKKYFVVSKLETEVNILYLTVLNTIVYPNNNSSFHLILVKLDLTFFF